MATGTAYAFFDCRYPLAEIKNTLLDVREMIGTPDGLELLLGDIRSDATRAAIIDPRTDAGVLDFLTLAREANLPYALKARSQTQNGEEVARELGAILNQTYNTPLYEEGETFRGEIIFDIGDGTYRMYE